MFKLTWFYGLSSGGPIFGHIYKTKIGFTVMEGLKVPDGEWLNKMEVDDLVEGFNKNGIIWSLEIKKSP